MPIELEDIEARRRSATFRYYGNEVHIEFWVEKITQEFRAEILRLQRASGRMAQRHKELKKRIDALAELPDTPEAATEDADAEKAIKQLTIDDAALKVEIDACVFLILAKWDVTQKGEPVAITLENLALVSDDFEGEILKAISGETEPVGEESGRRNTKPSPPSSRPKGLVSMRKGRSSRRHVG